MSRIPLRAVASPVDIFAPDATQLGTDGQDLVALAGSLAGFSDTLGQYAQYQSQEDRKAGFEEALQIQRERRLDNISQYRSLVEQGELKEGENPWKLVFLRQLVAQEQASNAALQIERDYYQNPPSDPDDFVAIRNDIQTRMSEHLNDLDSFEFQAVAGQVDDFTNRYISRHKSRRAEERVLEANEAVTNKLRSMFDGSRDTLTRLSDSLSLSESSPHGQQAQAYLSELQGVLDAAAATTPAPRVRQTALAVLEEAAISSRNPELAKKLIERISVDGQSLSAAVTADWYAQLDQRIARAEVADLQLAQAMDAASRHAVLQSVLETIRDFAAQGQNPFNAPIPAGLPPQVYEEIDSFQSLLAERQARGLMTDAAAKELRGTLTDNARMSLGETLIALDQNASASLNQIERLRATRATASYSDVTSPQTKLILSGLKHDPAIPLNERLDTLLTLAEQGTISEPDFNNTLSGIYSTAGASGTARAEFKQSVATRLDTLVMPSVARVYDAALGRMVPDPAQLLDLEQAKADIRDQLNQYLDLNPNATHEEMDAYADQLIDSSSSRLGGMTQQENQQRRSVVRARERFQAFESEGTIDPFTMPTGLQYGGEVGGRFSYFYRGDDGQTLSHNGPTPKFADNAQLYSNRAFLTTLFTKLGIDPTDASVVTQFLRTQREHYYGNQRELSYLDHLITELERNGRFHQRPASE